MASQARALGRPDRSAQTRTAHIARKSDGRPFEIHNQAG